MMTEMQYNPLANDLDEILTRTSDLWEEFRGKRIFMTGGTGFFGSWFLESFLWANEKLSLGASIMVLTRNAEQFKKKMPHLGTHPAVQFHQGDVRDFEFPSGEFSHIIHAAATSAVATFNNEDPLIKYETIVQGTKHTLDFAVKCGAKKFLYTSSGVMYGPQPPELTHIPDDYPGAPNPSDIKSVWGESKRAAELHCAYYGANYGLEIKIARCFTFVGPYLPLDIHYAIGNFIQDVLNGNDLQIKGDGTPFRSYLYASDLMIWLWTILARGKPGQAYNVGSENAVSIAELAHLVAGFSNKGLAVRIAKANSGGPTERYVPATKKAKNDLQLTETVGLSEAIQRTINFIKQHSTIDMTEKINEIFNQKKGQPKLLFIFEMANNHMGDVEHGLKIIREFSAVAKDFPEFNFAFKFQYRDLDTFIHPDFKDKVDHKYVKRFSETRLSEDQFLRLKDEVQKQGLISMCTPFDEKSVDNVVKHGYDIIKVASCSQTDWPLWEKIVATDKPIISSTGGAKLENIDRVVSFLQHRKKQFAILHCIGQYPTPPEQLQLNQINFLKERYPDVTIGFSTHEEPGNSDAIKMAIAKGAVIFEKHVGVKTDNYALNAYSATPEQVKIWLEGARYAFNSCGVSGQRHESTAQELADIRQFQRGAFAAVDIKAGEKVEVKNTFFAFPNQGGQILANDMSKYMVFTATKDYKKNEPIMESDVVKTDTREKVYAAIGKINEILRQANIPFSNKWDFELSHHYGLDKFYEVGIGMASCINREYCKKLIIVLPGQKHPVHYHKIKEETFNVLYGTITFILDDQRIEAKAGDIITVERGVKHGFESAEGCIFEEVSTTHIVGDSYYEDPAIMQNKNRKTALTYWIV